MPTLLNSMDIGQLFYLLFFFVSFLLSVKSHINYSNGVSEPIVLLCHLQLPGLRGSIEYMIKDLFIMIWTILPLELVFGMELGLIILIFHTFNPSKDFPWSLI